MLEQALNKMHKTLAKAGLFVLFSLASVCVIADSAEKAIEFKSEVDRIRYISLIDELRCPKCQNQNLADSNAGIAVDLRNEVQRLLREGESDKEILDFMVSRYGDYVLYRPPLQGNTVLLWALPAIFALLGVIALIMIWRSKNQSRETEDLPAVDDTQLEQLLGGSQTDSEKGD